MRRRLHPDEAALWHHVARTVRALPGRAAPPLPPTRGEAAPVVAFRPMPPAPSSRPRAPRMGDGHLDGSWDRKLLTGAVAPDAQIDLHGCTLAQAHDRLLHAIDRAIGQQARVLLIVTGRAPRAGASRIDLPLRGIIRASIGDWLAASRHAARIAAVRPAHPRHGGAGALYVILRRARP